MTKFIDQHKKELTKSEAVGILAIAGFIAANHHTNEHSQQDAFRNPEVIKVMAEMLSGLISD